MRKSISFISLILIGCSQILGQNVSHDVRYFNDDTIPEINIGGFGYYGSTVFDSRTTELFYKGGFYDNDAKQESINRLKDLNNFGGEYGFSAYYVNPKIKLFGDFGFTLGFEVAGSGGVVFSRDLYRIIFEGNANYIGDSAVFSLTEVKEYQFKKLFLGLTNNNRLKVGISLMSFDSWNNGLVEQSYLYTDPSSDSLRMSVNGRFENNKRTAESGPIGYGLGVDFEMIVPINPSHDTTNAAKLVLGARNVGVFMSTTAMNVYEMDTAYQYLGFNINDLSSFQSSFWNGQALEDSLVPSAKEERVFAMLPFEVYFYAPSKPDGPKLQLIYGFRYRNGSAALPYVYAGGDFRTNEKTIWTSTIGFGGYSYIQWGLSYRKKIGDFKIGLLTNNLHGFFTKEAYGKSIGISMSYGFK